MRTRKDYAKEFELVVQQEIKNHNNAVLATNIALENSRKSVLDLNEKMNKKFAQYENRFSEQDLSVVKLKDFFDTSFYQLSLRIGNLSKKFEQFQLATEESFQRIGKSTALKNDLEKLCDDVNKSVIQMNQEYLKLKYSLENGLEKIANDFKTYLQAFRRELLERPSEAQAVKNELEKKIEIAAIDAAGLIKEVQVCKKGSLIIEKKIENIYTLIERLDKRISA